MNDLMFGETAELSMRLLLWICQMENLNDVVTSIPDENLCDFIILAHMLKNESLLMFEAKSILHTITDVINRKVPVNIKYPERIDERALRVCFLYSKLFFILHSCLGSIGIKRFQVNPISYKTYGFLSALTSLFNFRVISSSTMFTFRRFIKLRKG